MNINIGGVHQNQRQQEIFNYMSNMCRQHKGCEGCFLAGGQTFKDESAKVKSYIEVFIFIFKGLFSEILGLK